MDKHSEAMLNTVQHILADGLSKKNPGEITGRTESNRLVHFKGSPELIGKIIPVKITGVKRTALSGEII
jgi:tRNA-2-methylthio-N6-dimethylallyladenosine synthase